MDEFKILAINPGSTSTKIAVYNNNKSIFLKSIKHSVEDLAQFKTITDQFDYRKKIILEELGQTGIDVNKISAVVGRGGLLKPIESGVYEVNEQMKSDLRSCIMGEHASNLGALIADDIAQSLPNAKAFIADPVVVDELNDVARISGHPLFKRVSIFHALNQKAIARLHAKSLNKPYEELNLIVAHLGGGISVGAHHNGRVIDVNNALDGDGPFAERARHFLLVRQQNYAIAANTPTTKLKNDHRKRWTSRSRECCNAYEIEVKRSEVAMLWVVLQDAMAYNVEKAIGRNGYRVEKK